MKKLAILILLLGGYIQNIQAQWAGGVRVGAGLSNVSTPSIIDIVSSEFHYMPGVSVGLTGEYSFNSDWSVMSELNYQQKGFRVNEHMDLNLFRNINVPLGVKVDTRVDYVDVPLLVKYAFGNGPVKAYAAVGPQISYALSGQIRTRANLLLDFNVMKTPINLSSLKYQRFDVGAVAVAGVDIPTGNGSIFFDARFQQGFNDSFRLPVVDLNIKNHGFGFGLGYKMAL